MAVTYGFFNSVNGDRKYNAEQMSEYFRGIINEGVYQHLDGGLAVTAGTGLAVSVASGRAIIQNRWVQNSAAMSLTIAAASETYARKDAVVIRLNWSSRSISIAVKTGTPAASPVAPSMTRNSTTYEMALAYVNVAANATSVTVTDKRSDSTVCGWVTVAQSTSGEVDAQLNDMKTGFDGVTYPTPGDAVRSCDESLNNKITDINSITPNIFSNVSNYNTSVSPSTFFVSDRVIPEGSYIKTIKYYVTTVSQAWLYIIDNTTKKVLKRIIVETIIGWNETAVKYYCENNVIVGLFDIYTINRQEYATNPNLITSDCIFSIGSQTASPTRAEEGDVLTITTSSSNVICAYPIQVCYTQNESMSVYNKSVDDAITSGDLSIWDKINGNDKIMPLVYEDLTKYENAAPAAWCIFSDKVLMSGTFLKSVRIYGNTSSEYVYFYLMDNSTHRINNCVIKSVNQGWNTIVLNWYIETDSVLGFYGNVFNFKLIALNDMKGDPLSEYAFSDGFHESANTKQFAIGDIVEDYTSYSQGRNMLLPVQWQIVTNNMSVAYLRSTVPVYNHNCIVSIIDDDTGVNVPEIWDGIISNTGIRMGFACVTGIISGAVSPPSVQLTPMTVSQLKAYYNDGHEVYSHSYSHLAFYDDSTTEEEIANQCVKSKSWLDENGFDRTSNIIVYPGGLGLVRTGKQQVVRRFYKYGVDTVIGDGINDEPIFNAYAIHRINGDTSTLAQLKAVVDKAIATNKILVLMCHAYELIQDKTNQIAKLNEFITYAQAQGATFMPLGEALHFVYGWKD